MRRLAALLTLLAFASIATACGDDGESPATSTDPGNAGTTQNDGGAQAGSGKASTRGVIEVEITADGFNPASAKVRVKQEYEFNNSDSKPHTIVFPAGDEQVVEPGEALSLKTEGCCAATFTDKQTRAEFAVRVPRSATGF